ncbi:MAG: hypothetical protein FWB98_06505 [Defluviitaleaceae bacterium]|nr:hypothetical protein [Defluviitaleaceae bacterium]
MATNNELQAWYRRSLHALLTIRTLNKGIEVKGLDAQISTLETEMGSEEAAWVREQVAKEYGPL